MGEYLPFFIFYKCLSNEVNIMKYESNYNRKLIKDLYDITITDGVIVIQQKQNLSKRDRIHKNQYSSS